MTGGKGFVGIVDGPGGNLGIRARVRNDVFIGAVGRLARFARVEKVWPRLTDHEFHSFAKECKR